MLHFHHQPPPYPVRRQETIDAITKLCADEAWTRLEGAPELEADLAAFHHNDPQGRPPLPWFISSGTAALEAIMLGHGIGPGDQVLTTPYTWGATVSAILAIGAIPRFADIDLHSGLLTAETIAAALTPQCKAVLVVHLFGQSCDMAGIREVCNAHQVLLFEDASQAHGARWQGQRVGDWGDAAAFSCMGLKPLAGSEGGYAIFRDRQAAETAWLYGKHPRGLDNETAQRLGEQGLLDALQLGWRNCTFSATLLRHALPYLDQENAARRANIAHLRQYLGDCPWVSIAPEPDDAHHVYHLLSLLWQGDHWSRETFHQRLLQRGVENFLYIPTPIHRLKRMQTNGYEGPPVFWHDTLKRAGIDYSQESYPAAEQRCRSSVEMGFNWTRENAAAMADLAACILEAAQPDSGQ